MKSFIISVCLMLVCSCNKSQIKKHEQHKTNCGCDSDSIVNVRVDSIGWLRFDSASNTYSIYDTLQNNFLDIYRICNPEINDITSITLSNNNQVEIYYSGKVRPKCPDSLVTLPEVFHAIITIDSLRKK